MHKTRVGRHGLFHSHKDRDQLERWLGREPWRENIALAFVASGTLALLGLFLYSLLKGM